MAVFTNTSAVRDKFQLLDTTLAPDSLIEGCIEAAHVEVLRFLAADYTEEPVETGVAHGETLLAGAHVFRSLAARDAFEQKQVTIGRERVESGRRFAALCAVAAAAEEQAWRVLEPYLAEGPRAAVVRLSDTVPVLGL